MAGFYFARPDDVFGVRVRSNRFHSVHQAAAQAVRVLVVIAAAKYAPIDIYEVEFLVLVECAGNRGAVFAKPEFIQIGD